MPRQARLDAPGTLHHVIVRGIEERRIVRNVKDRNEFVERLGTLASEAQTAVYAWALLSKHAHLLVSSGPKGLSTFMRRLLTGYAGWFNRRHDRHGHVFQNRYKSIVCDESVYFCELVRYIHLNPLRAGRVSDLLALSTHRWCGHSVVMGTVERPWQDRVRVLQEFGSDEQSAIMAYEAFIADGVDQGHRPESARISHQLSVAVADLAAPAALRSVGRLDVLR